MGRVKLVMCTVLRTEPGTRRELSVAYFHFSDSRQVDQAHEECERYSQENHSEQKPGHMTRKGLQRCGRGTAGLELRTKSWGLEGKGLDGGEVKTRLEHEGPQRSYDKV